MAKKKIPLEIALKDNLKVVSKKLLLEEDLKSISIPFDLYTAFSSVVEEMEAKEFDYDSMISSSQPVVIFKSKKKEEKILINVTKENLLIKHFSEKDNIKKLKVIYVVKPSERNFNLILKS
jgi:hypothetical protein